MPRHRPRTLPSVQGGSGAAFDYSTGRKTVITNRRQHTEQQQKATRLEIEGLVRELEAKPRLNPQEEMMLRCSRDLLASGKLGPSTAARSGRPVAATPSSTQTDARMRAEVDAIKLELAAQHEVDTIKGELAARDAEAQRPRTPGYQGPS